MVCMDALIIRSATAADAADLERLAALDSRRLSDGPHSAPSQTRCTVQPRSVGDCRMVHKYAIVASM